MAWNDDSWRDGYDAWKLASPDDDYEDDPCDHDEYEVDILDGRCWCDRCGHRWYATDEQVEREIERQAAYTEYEERENRKQWWRDRFDFILYPINRLRWKLQHLRWHWQRKPVLDDDIPF